MLYTPSQGKFLVKLITELKKVNNNFNDIKQTIKDELFKEYQILSSKEKLALQFINPSKKNKNEFELKEGFVEHYEEFFKEKEEKVEWENLTLNLSNAELLFVSCMKASFDYQEYQMLAETLNVEVIDIKTISQEIKNKLITARVYFNSSVAELFSSQSLQQEKIIFIQDNTFITLYQRTCGFSLEKIGEPKSHIFINSVINSAKGYVAKDDKTLNKMMNTPQLNQYFRGNWDYKLEVILAYPSKVIKKSQKKENINKPKNITKITK